MHSSDRRRHVVGALLVALLMTFSLASTAGAETLRPSPSQAPNDTERLWRDGCLAFESNTQPPIPPRCVYGDPKGTFAMALVGDSHTSDLFPAFNIVAKAHHWRLYVFVKIDCPFLDIPIRNAHLLRHYPQCTTWNNAVLGLLQELKPDLTITEPFRWIFPEDQSQATPTAEGAAIGRMLAQVPGRSIVMVDTPYSSRDVPTCLESYTEAQCAIPRSQVLEGGIRVRERKAAAVAGGSYMDLTSQICGGFPCRVVTDGILEFRDGHHLTATYSRSLAPIVDAALQKILQ